MPSVHEIPCNHSECAYVAESAEALSSHIARAHRPFITVKDVALPSVTLPGGILVSEDGEKEPRFFRSVTLEPWSGYEEDLIGNVTLAKDGEHLRRLVANCIVKLDDLDLPFENRPPHLQALARRAVSCMRISDKTYLMILLRMMSLREGNIYRFKTECPAPGCGYGKDTPWVERVDLNSLRVYSIPDGERQVRTFKLPKSGKVVRFRAITCSDEPEFILLRQKHSDKMVSAQMWLQIMDIDGAKVPNPRDIQRLSAYDRDELRQEMERTDGGIDLEIVTECPKCHNVMRHGLEIGLPFFIPSLLASERV